MIESAVSTHNQNEDPSLFMVHLPRPAWELGRSGSNVPVHRPLPESAPPQQQDGGYQNAKPRNSMDQAQENSREAQQRVELRQSSELESQSGHWRIQTNPMYFPN